MKGIYFSLYCLATEVENIVHSAVKGSEIRSSWLEAKELGPAVMNLPANWPAIMNPLSFPK